MTTIRESETALAALCAQHNIDGKSRILFASYVTWLPNSGDAWYVLQRVPIYEARYNCKLVLLVNPETRRIVEERVSLLEYDSYSFELLEIPDSFEAPDDYPRPTGEFAFGDARLDYLMNRRPTRKIRTSVPGTSILGTSAYMRFSRFFQLLTGSHQELGVRKPYVHQIDVARYVREHRIHPGNTVLLVPESNSVTSPPPSFWNAVALQLKQRGFQVVFNTQNPIYIGERVFAPWKDVLGVVELCGNVAGIRTGFFDFAIDANARFSILTPHKWRRQLERAHPNVDSKKVNWIVIGKRYSTKDDFLCCVGAKIPFAYYCLHSVLWARLRLQYLSRKHNTLKTLIREVQSISLMGGSRS